MFKDLLDKKCACSEDTDKVKSLRLDRLALNTGGSCQSSRGLPCLIVMVLWVFRTLPG